jgi:hypothetical protein
MKPAEIQISIIDHKTGDKLKFSSNSASFLLGLVFEPEDLGDKFLRNVGPCPNCTALQPREP